MRREAMAIRTETKNGLMICRVEGDIDINCSPELKKAFDKLTSQKTPKIVIELSKVAYVDSSGLATLVGILKNMRSYGGKMRLAGMSPKIKSLFEITKLDKLFEIMASEEEAITGL
jgi:anti-sigma B factor antagonist